MNHSINLTLDQFSSSDEDEEENTAEETEPVTQTKDQGCSILYEYEDSEASVIDSPPKKVIITQLIYTTCTIYYFESIY